MQGGVRGDRTLRKRGARGKASNRRRQKRPRHPARTPPHVTHRQSSLRKAHKNLPLYRPKCEVPHTGKVYSRYFGPAREATSRNRMQQKSPKYPANATGIRGVFLLTNTIGSVNHYNSLQLSQVSSNMRRADEGDPLRRQKAEAHGEPIDQVLHIFSSHRRGRRPMAVLRGPGMGGRRRQRSGDP